MGSGDGRLLQFGAASGLIAHITRRESGSNHVGSSSCSSRSSSEWMSATKRCRSTSASSSARRRPHRPVAPPSRRVDALVPIALAHRSATFRGSRVGAGCRSAVVGPGIARTRRGSHRGCTTVVLDSSDTVLSSGGACRPSARVACPAVCWAQQRRRDASLCGL